MKSLARHIQYYGSKLKILPIYPEVISVTEQEILQQIEEIKHKTIRTIYDFNKLRKLEKELEEIRNGNNEEAEV